MLVLRRLKRILNYVGNLDNSLDTRRGVGSWSVPHEAIFVNFLKSCAAEEGRIVFLDGLHSELLPRQLEVHLSSLLRGVAQI